MQLRAELLKHMWTGFLLALGVKHMHSWLRSPSRESLDIPWISSGRPADCSGWRTNAWEEISRVTKSCAMKTHSEQFFKKTCLEGFSEGSRTELWLSTALKNCSLESGLIKRYDRIRITLWSIGNFSALHTDGSRGLPQPRTRSKKHFLMSQFKNCT